VKKSLPVPLLVKDKSVKMNEAGDPILLKINKFFKVEKEMLNFKILQRIIRM
jgi:hypothetical protein